MEITIVDSKSTLESDWYRNRHPHLLESEFKLSTIRFGTPNHISLKETDHSI